MPGPGIGGPHGGFHGGVGFGPRPIPHHHYFYHRPFGSSFLGIGLTAMIGSMIGNSISNKNNQTYSNNNYTSSGRSYEYFNYCPNCGKERNNTNTYCGYCGSSLIR